MWVRPSSDQVLTPIRMACYRLLSGVVAPVARLHASVSALHSSSSYSLNLLAVALVDGDSMNGLNYSELANWDGGLLPTSGGDINLPSGSGPASPAPRMGTDAATGASPAKDAPSVPSGPLELLAYATTMSAALAENETPEALQTDAALGGERSDVDMAEATSADASSTVSGPLRAVKEEEQEVDWYAGDEQSKATRMTPLFTPELEEKEVRLLRLRGDATVAARSHPLARSSLTLCQCPRTRLSNPWKKTLRVLSPLQRKQSHMRPTGRRSTACRRTAMQMLQLLVGRIRATQPCKRRMQARCSMPMARRTTRRALLHILSHRFLPGALVHIRTSSWTLRRSTTCPARRLQRRPLHKTHPSYLRPPLMSCPHSSLRSGLVVCRRWHLESRRP